MPDRLFLDAFEMEQHQSRADEIERIRPQHIERVVEDAVLEYLEIRELESRQVTGVDVGRDNVAGRTHLLGQPHRHRATPCSDLQTPPPRLNECAPPARDRIVDLLEKIEPPILRGLPAGGGKAIVKSLGAHNQPP